MNAASKFATRTASLTAPPLHRMITGASTQRAAFRPQPSQRWQRHRRRPNWWLRQAITPGPVAQNTHRQITAIAQPEKPVLRAVIFPLPCLLPLIWILHLGLWTSSASIITGNLLTTSGNAYVTNALFTPLSTPLASGVNTIASTSTNVLAAANGSFSVTLKQGNYLVTIGGLRHDSFIISVPDDANTYNVNSLITNGLTFNYTYSPVYEQRVNKGQADGYVGLIGTLLTPSGLMASNLTLLGTVNLGADAANHAALYVNQNSTLYVQPGGSLTLAGDSSPRAELFLHGTNAFIRFDEDAAINDSTAGRIWKFNRSNVTSNNVATLGEVTNVVNSFGNVPIGAIVAWDKSLSGVPALPANFVECNGQTLSDAASPLNGQTIRNLNGVNRFLRGNSTSGATGGGATHVHSFSGVTDIEDGDHDVQSPSGSPVSVAAFAHTHAFSGTTGSGSSLPPYMDMVWVMRIK